MQSFHTIFETSKERQKFVMKQTGRIAVNRIVKVVGDHSLNA